MKPNRIVFIVAILVIVGLLVRGHSQTERLSAATGWPEQREAIEYIESKEDLTPVAFIIAKQITELTGDKSQFRSIILLAQANKKDELIQMINNI